MEAGHFALLPYGPLWKSEDAGAITRFLDEFAGRTSDDIVHTQMQCFELLVRALGVETCREILARVEEDEEDEDEEDEEEEEEQLPPPPQGTTMNMHSTQSSHSAPSMMQPATLFWRDGPPRIPAAMMSTVPMTFPHLTWTNASVPEEGGGGGETADPAPAAGAAAAPDVDVGRKRTRSSSGVGSFPASSSSGDPYIPTLRNDGPWPYLGNLLAQGYQGVERGDAVGHGVEGGQGGHQIIEDAEESGSEDDSSSQVGGKHQPAAMAFGRYGDYLPYNGRKMCRIKGCLSNQRWPDYLCGNHGGGRCRWDGCTLFHQGINSVGLLLCGKHSKAVGASYRRPQKPRKS